MGARAPFFCLLTLLCSALSRAPAAPADLVFVNGAVYTVDSPRSWASALVVTNGRITYVGNDATASAFAGPATRTVDLAHRLLLPGFQDSHVHPAEAPNPANTLDLHGVTDREKVIDRIREFARAHPEKSWILGGGWDEAAFLPSGQPTRQMLDAAVPDRPAYLTNNSLHQGWANSRALAAARITRDTPDPENGRIEHDGGGEPAGVLQEDSAMLLLVAAIPPPSAQDRVKDLSAALQEMIRLGVTALENADSGPDVVRAYRTLDEAGQLKIRANLCQTFSPAKNDEAQIRSFIEQRDALTGGRLSATCVKIFLDGAYGSHTVALLQPYSDEPRKYGSGKLFVEPRRLDRLVARLDAAGMQVHMHAEGDAAVRAGLDAVANARRLNGVRDNRHTLAHLCLIDESDIARFRTLNVIANMTPLWSINDPWEAVFAPRLFGVERASRLYPTRALLDAGAILVWGSDWPVTGVSPLEGLETAITHRYPGGNDPEGKEDRAFNPQQRVNLEQAIVAYTTAGAYLMHEDAVRGSLAPGKAADLVVLHENLFDKAPLDIHTVQVDMTVSAGNVLFERTAR